MQKLKYSEDEKQGRIGKAARQSAELRSGRRIMDTALKYGWESHNGFTKAFKKEFGYCPALLRAMVISIQESGGESMSEKTIVQVDEHASKEALFEILKRKLLQMHPDLDEKEVYRIYQYACGIYRGQKRYSGDEYITHPLHTAILLADMEADYDTICAGLFCDVIQKNLATRENMKEHLPETIVELIVGVGEESEKETEEIIEQITLVRLAARLHNMPTIRYMDEEQRKRRAEETREIFVPLAERMGNDKMAEELRALSEKSL